MARSKTVKLLLIDGELDGRIQCTVGNWIGVVYKSPRTMLSQFAGNDLNYLKQAGVYLLFGTDAEGGQAIYIGQAGNRKNGNGLLGRVQEPHDTIIWTETVMFTTKDNSFGLDDISYLENRFYNMSIEAGRYQVANENDPNPGNLMNGRDSELEEYIDYAKMVMNTLGYKVFVPVTSKGQDADEYETLLFMERHEGKATGKQTRDGFVIFKGSKINPAMTKSCPESVIKARAGYADKINRKYELTSDITMSSASAAASFIGGASINGLTAWHDSEGQTLKQLEESR